MTHLGKTGKTGKLTRSAFVADQVGQKMIKSDPRVGELCNISKEKDGLFMEFDRNQDLIENMKRHAEGITFEFEQAKEDLLNQNPYADAAPFDKDLKVSLIDLDDDWINALANIDAVKLTIPVKRTIMRGVEDVRIADYASYLAIGGFYNPPIYSEKSSLTSDLSRRYSVHNTHLIELI